MIRQIADRPVPPETNNPDLDDNERVELPWWKCKSGRYIFYTECSKGN